MEPEERRAIEADCIRLIHQYTWANDARDWALCASLYTSDARFARPSRPDHFIEGRAAILASFTARPARAQRHVIANTLVEVEGPARARARSVIILYMGDAPAEGGGLSVQDPASPLIGTFTDLIVKTTKGWRFAERIGGLDFRP